MKKQDRAKLSLEELAVLDTLTAVRKRYPTPMSPDQLGALLNEVVWVHRDKGLGLLKKASGARCNQPVTATSISKDILMWPMDGIGYIHDVLIDSDGMAKPTWSGRGAKRPLSLSLFVKPVDVQAPPPPPPPPPKIPYDDQKASEFGQGCNQIYTESGAAFDTGMVAVHAARATYDHYVGEMPWPQARDKHLNELRAQYGLPPK